MFSVLPGMVSVWYLKPQMSPKDLWQQAEQVKKERRSGKRTERGRGVGREGEEEKNGKLEMIQL